MLSACRRDNFWSYLLTCVGSINKSMLMRRQDEQEQMSNFLSTGSMAQQYLQASVWIQGPIGGLGSLEDHKKQEKTHA